MPVTPNSTVYVVTLQNRQAGIDITYCFSSEAKRATFITLAQNTGLTFPITNMSFVTHDVVVDATGTI